MEAVILIIMKGAKVTISGFSSHGLISDLPSRIYVEQRVT